MFICELAPAQLHAPTHKGFVMNDENVFVITTEVVDAEDDIFIGPKYTGRSTRAHTGLTFDGRWVTLPYRGPFIHHRLSDLDEPYSSKRGSGKSSLLKVLAELWSPSRRSDESALCHSLRKPFKGLAQPALAEAAVIGVPVCKGTTQVNRYTPERSEMCVNCFRRDRFECTCNNYLSLRDSARPGRVSVYDQFGNDLVPFGNLQGNGQV